MGRIMKKEDLACELAEKCNFYKCNMREVVDALQDVILAQLKKATFDEDSEIHIMPGLVIGGRRVPEREAKDPRTGEVIISPEKVIPYATFKPSLRLKLYKKPKGYKKKTRKKV
jgi:nucleoid DNA-binding protein